MTEDERKISRDEIKKVIAKKEEEANKLIALWTETANKLNIPSRIEMHHFSYDVVVSMSDLWAIFSDEDKLKELVSRVRNKAFW